MIDAIAASAEVLKRAGFNTAAITVKGRSALAFEDPTVVGFLFPYVLPQDLIGTWQQDASNVIADHQLGLRRAGQKAWNVYMVLLAIEAPNYIDSALLAAIEEDLTGTRKIARAGFKDIADVRAALLPLLPLQAAPQLEAVDIPAEIRQRATELPQRAVDAFLSGTEEASVVQVLEDAS